MARVLCVCMLIFTAGFPGCSSENPKEGITKNGETVPLATSQESRKQAVHAEPKHHVFVEISRPEEVTKDTVPTLLPKGLYVVMVKGAQEDQVAKWLVTPPNKVYLAGEVEGDTLTFTTLVLKTPAELLQANEELRSEFLEKITWTEALKKTDDIVSLGSVSFEIPKLSEVDAESEKFIGIKQQEPWWSARILVGDLALAASESSDENKGPEVQDPNAANRGLYEIPQDYTYTPPVNADITQDQIDKAKAFLKHAEEVAQAGRKLGAADERRRREDGCAVGPKVQKLVEKIQSTPEFPVVPNKYESVGELQQGRAIPGSDGPLRVAYETMEYHKAVSSVLTTAIDVFPGEIISGKSLLSPNPAGGKSIVPLTLNAGQDMKIFSPLDFTMKGATFRNGFWMDGAKLEKVMTNDSPNKHLSFAQNVQAPLLAQNVINIPQNISYQIAQVFSQDHFCYQFGTSASYCGFAGMAAAGAGAQSREEVTFAVLFRQDHYSIGVDDPMFLSCWFTKNAEDFADQIANQIAADDPPLYISKVTYGKYGMLLYTACGEATEIAAALAGTFQYGVVSAEASAAMAKLSTFRKARIQFRMYGGPVVGVRGQPCEGAIFSDFFLRVALRWRRVFRCRSNVEEAAASLVLGLASEKIRATHLSPVA